MIIWQLLIIGFLILLNGFFALAELAIVSARPVRLRQMAAEGKRGAASALRLIDDPVKLLSTVQIGITLIGVVAGAYSGATLADPLAEYVRAIPILAPYAHGVAFFAVVVSVTYLSLVIGELVPKRIALHHAETVAAAVAPIMSLLAKIGAPVVWFLRISTQAVLTLFRIKPAKDMNVTEEEVRALIAEGAAVGVFHRAEQEMIDGVLRIGDRTVRSIMVPRPAVEWLNAEASPAELFQQIALTGHSRYPVARGDIENVIGVAHTKDLLEQQYRHGTIDVVSAAREAPFVLELTPVLRLLALFRASVVHMAIIVDERGTFEGLVTPTDILTAIAGDLPQTEEETEPDAVRRDDGTWLLDGMMSVDDAERVLGIRGMGEGGDFNTIAGFVLHHLGRIPVSGEHVMWNGWRFEVVDLDGRRIDKILACPPADDPDAP